MASHLLEIVVAKCYKTQNRSIFFFKGLDFTHPNRIECLGSGGSTKS